jgi:hypothetical protein
MSTFICEETTDRVVAIDLMEVPVVDRGAVKLLARSESNGAELRTARPISVDGSRREGNTNSSEQGIEDRGGYRGCLIRVTALTVIRKVQG